MSYLPDHFELLSLRHDVFRLQESGYRAARNVGIYDFDGVVPVQPEHLPQQQAGDSLSAVLPLHRDLRDVARRGFENAVAGEFLFGEYAQTDEISGGSSYGFETVLPRGREIPKGGDRSEFFGICPSHRVGQAGRIAPVGDFRVRPAEIVELPDRLEPQIPVNGHGSGVVLQHLQQILSDARPP